MSNHLPDKEVAIMERSVAHRFPRADAAVPEARSFLRSVLTEWDITDRSDDVLLCVTELATNSIRHGAPMGGHFLIEASLDDGCLRVAVHDASRRQPQVKHPSTDDTDGRGLLLVDSLSDGWGVEPRKPGGKTVWSEFKISSAVTGGAARALSIQHERGSNACDTD